MRLVLLNGGVVLKVSDMKELTFEDYGLLEYTHSAAPATTRAIVKKHLSV